MRKHMLAAALMLFMASTACAGGWKYAIVFMAERPDHNPDWSSTDRNVKLQDLTKKNQAIDMLDRMGEKNWELMFMREDKGEILSVTYYYFKQPK